MILIKQITSLLIIFNFLFCSCDGFNWYHNIKIEDCNKGDINTLNHFIINSGNSLEMDMDTNYDGKISALELGWQLWENGRLIHWICQEVPSPFYFYEYDCGLSGYIPNNISNLNALVKIRLQNNNLEGSIPLSICDLNNYNLGSYWFNLENNSLCPPYPNCIQNTIGTQNITNCK